MAVTTTTQDVVHMLEQDHRKVKGLLKELQDAEGREAKRLLKTITKELQIHSAVEEELVYPAFRSSVGTADAKIEVEESLAEHENVDQLLEGLASRDPSTATFKGRARFLKEAVEHHAREEEKSMLPGLRRALSKQKLEELGRKVQRRREELENGPSRAGGGRSGNTGGSRSGSRTGARGGAKGSRSTTGRAQDTGGNTQERTRQELYEEAQRRNIPGRSGMDKRQLQQALRRK